MTGLANSSNGQHRILVVDDDTNVRVSLTKALSLQGFSVSSAESGEKALAILRSAPYTLMILDMMMPGMDGVEVMRQTRSIQPHLLILVLTAHASLDYAIASIKMHAVDFLQKPVSTRQVRETVNKLIQSHIDQMNRDKLVDAIANAVETLGGRSNEQNELKAGETDIVYLPPIRLNKTTKTVVVDNAPKVQIALSDGESTLLAFLMEHATEVVTAKQIAICLWNDFEMDELTAQGLVRPYISRLRTKLPILKVAPPILRTVRSRGYLFMPQDIIK